MYIHISMDIMDEVSTHESVMVKEATCHLIICEYFCLFTFYSHNFLFSHHSKPHMSVPTRAEIAPSSVAVCLILLGQDLHQTLEFATWGLQQARVLWLEVFLHCYWGSKLRSLCLYSKCSCPLSHLPSLNTCFKHFPPLGASNSCWFFCLQLLPPCSFFFPHSVVLYK